MNHSSKRIINMESSSGSSEIIFAFDAGRHEENVHKFKGVVPQQNGNWGAQIYAHHQRIWLGTFKSEREAAMAYDSASIKLRSGECHRNFPWNDQTVQEPMFQSHYSVEAVLSMIRDGTYPSHFATFLSTHQAQQGLAKHISLNGDEKFCCTQLFQKELTPSDVGKLNRLVIPKKHAVTYFPYANDESVDVEVVFYDKLMRLWKFRYCYWKSSQSYVFTRGWNRFVKDKNLKAKDIVAFFICEPITWGKGEAFSMIDVVYDVNNADRHKQILGSCEVEETKQDGNISAHKGLRLFGVSIS
ncbi:hypothetical protein Fmac_022878 [Flemingia macrophylla]|uniref:AP2/ERF and B3 domain-containing transcription factor n=1 Tax=Flemingia macrophylla TaxID=520843 RepID=A0ABD1LJX4_9FABA